MMDDKYNPWEKGTKPAHISLFETLELVDDEKYVAIMHPSHINIVGVLKREIPNLEVRLSPLMLKEKVVLTKKKNLKNILRL